MQQTYSGKRLSFYQIFRSESLQIEIPIIQRDYAQGRNAEREVRTAFLDALYRYLQEGIPSRDLDFVYGTIRKDKVHHNGVDTEKAARIFVPLDGQQRLTTLFLLHWYLAQISGNANSLRQVLSVNGCSLFSYETRTSSKEFCKALVTNIIDFDHLLKDENEVESVTYTIKDRGWFYLSWTDDPTIRAMLTMLDAIHERFKGCKEFYDQLVDLDKPVITFLFLDLHDFNLTDDLYIKMNARGKPLSDFENFKAQFEKSIKRYQGQWPEYRLPFREGSVSGYEYFIHKIDTDWADLFWAYRNEATSDNTFDDELMNFIALVIANFEILRVDLDSENILKSRDRLFGPGGKLQRLSFMEYGALGCLSQKKLIHLMEMFDLLNHEKGSDGKLKPYLSENGYYIEEKNFIKVITNNTSYPEKLRFYAFYAGLSNGLIGATLLSWMRIIFNLTENTIINDADAYHRAIKSIRDLVEQGDPINKQLMQDLPVSGFTESQVLEEKIKAHLLDRSDEWKHEILKVENHPFFRGQIGFILKFSGIVDYYISNKNTNWDESDQEYLESFKRYAESASAVFYSIEQDSGSINYAWERAVLTKGDYLTSASASRFNLLSTRLNKNNIERDHSWRRLLRVSSNQDEIWGYKQSYVKAVLDDPNFDTKDVQGSLEMICDEALRKSGCQDWRFLFVSKPDLFKICQQGFIVKNDNEIVLLHESQRNHFHSEIYSKFLELDLIDRQVKTAPFGRFDYERARSKDDNTYIKFSDFNYSDNQYVLKVWYELNRYIFLFYNLNNDFCHASLLEILSDNKFCLVQDWVGNPIKDLSKYTNGYIFECETVGQASDKLKDLFEKLCDLNDSKI